MVVIFFYLKNIFKGRKYLKDRFEGADLILVGGGQLISDVDLNFPLKLYFVVKFAEELGIPVRFISVGVSSKWSKIGLYIMKRVLMSPVVSDISVRDYLSLKNLNSFFGEISSVVLPDPALLCPFVYPVFHNSHNSRKKIGLGLASVSALNYSADLKNGEEDNTVYNVLELIQIFNSLGFDVELFTNGAYEDELYLDDIVVPFLKNTSISFTRAPHMVTAFDLVNYIASLDLVIAYRLHANIIASSFGIPHYAVNWDRKVEAFFSMQGRHGFVFPSMRALVDSQEIILSNQLFSNVLSCDSVLQEYLDFFVNR